MGKYGKQELPSLLTLSGNITGTSKKSQRKLPPDERDTDTLESIQNAWLDQGHHELEVSFGHESNLSIRQKRCRKNPGHVGFIEAAKFCAEDLPPKYRTDANLLSLIKALIVLTVRLTVRYVSFNRPEFHPGTRAPFPFFHHRGSTRFRTVGSGWIYRVEKFSDRKCPVNGCQNSVESCHTWAMIYVRTAAHVVFDQEEGKNTTCHFSYDSSERSLSSCPSICGTWSAFSLLIQDGSNLIFVSHEAALIETLGNSMSLYDDMCQKVWEKYHGDIDKRVLKMYWDRRYEKCLHWTTVSTKYIDRYKHSEVNTADHELLMYYTGRYQRWQTEMEECDRKRKDLESASHDGNKSEQHFLTNYNPDHTLTVLVSHPHGLSKTVTLGETSSRQEEDVGYPDGYIDIMSSYSYTTKSCPGSSGGPVLMLERRWNIGCSHPHSGSGQATGNTQVNVSGGGWDL